jgi:hypothetical protein
MGRRGGGSSWGGAGGGHGRSAVVEGESFHGNDGGRGASELAGSPGAGRGGAELGMYEMELSLVGVR